VASEPGQGSVFRLYLPLAPAAVLPLPAPAPPSPRFARVHSLLVVEDDFAVRRAYALALRQAGAQVFEAEDGVTAVEIFRRHQSLFQNPEKVVIFRCI
jgi:hypothetical protein